MWQMIASILSPLIAATGLAFAYFQWRKAQLRRDDVLAWANEVIESLEALLLVCLLEDPPLDPNTARSKSLEIAFRTATLVEQGRLFFKNEVIDNHGSHRPPAYRGYRPAILDPIVVAHQIACALPSANKEEKARMCVLAEDRLKTFVSLAEKEVGRQKSAAADARKKGDGLHLRHLMETVDESRLARRASLNQELRSQI